MANRLIQALEQQQATPQVSTPDTGVTNNTTVQPGQNRLINSLKKNNIVPKTVTPPAPDSKWQGAADVMNKPSILSSASKLFSNTAKFIGGAALNVANAITAKGHDVNALNESNQQLNDIDQEAIQKARILHAAGETEKAKRLLEIVKSHGNNITLNDLPLFKTGQENVKEIAGAGLGTALELGGFASGSGLPPSITSKATEVVSKIPGVKEAGSLLDKSKQLFPKITGAVEGATKAGAQAGLFGASAGLQEENPTFSSVMGSALDYATNPLVLATGGLIGGFAARANSPQRVAKAVDDLENKYVELATGKSMKTKLARDAVKTEMKNAAGTEGATAARTLAEDGIIPNQDATRLDTLQQAEQYRAKLKPFHELNRQVLQELDTTAPKVSLSELEQEAIQRVNTPQNVYNGTFDSLKKELQQEFAALRANLGDTVDYATLGDIKTARWGKTRFDATRPLLADANYAIGKVAQQRIEQTAKAMGNDEVAQLNRYIGDRLEAAKFLESLNQKVVKGGRLSKYIFSIIGASVGSSPLGRILGAFGGNEVANLLISQQVSNVLKRRILANIERQSPEAYAKTMQWLIKRKINPELILSLPAPKAGSKASEVYTPIHLENAGVQAGRQNIKPEDINFSANESGIIPNAPGPTPGAPVQIRPGQATLPPPPIIPPYRDTSGIIKNAPPPTPGVPVQIRPGQLTLPPPGSGSSAYQPPSFYSGNGGKALEGEVVDSIFLPPNLNKGVVPETTFKGAKGLLAEEKNLETRAFEKIRSSENQILDKYARENGNYVNADDLRKVFISEGYKGTNSAAVQEPVSYLSKKAYSRALKNPGEYATFTSGMSGAGKTSALKNIPEFNTIKADSAVIFDSNLSSYESAVKKINEAIENGKIPEVWYTYRDPIEGFENGVVKRMLNNPSEMGRVVPTSVVAENAPGSFEVAERLYKEGVQVHFIDNSLGAGNAKEVSLQEIKKKAKFPADLKSKLDNKAQQLYEQGTINEEQYKAFTNKVFARAT